MDRIVLSDDEVRARIGKPAAKLLMVLLDGALYRRVEGGWERYPEEDDG